MGRCVPLMNRKQAQKVMAQAGVDALILADPVNLYHATGFWPQTLWMGQTGSLFAVVPQDAEQPVVLIMSQFLHYHFDLDESADQSGLVFQLFTSLSEDGVEAGEPRFFQSGDDGPIDELERLSRQSTLAEMRLHAPDSSARRAAERVMRECAPKGRWAWDTVVAATLCEAIEHHQPAAPLLGRIRMIKSPAEIALMRHAARMNREAVCAAMKAISIGQSYADLRKIFYAETGRRDGIPLFLSTDSHMSKEWDGLIREGRCFSIDAVAHYQGYYGDFGRTVLVGDPHPKLRRALDASLCARDLIPHILRPGMRYSDVTRACHQAMRDAGFPAHTPASPHSVGLWHTDEAFDKEGLLFEKADHFIEPHMILSVDCPILQTDMQGTVHSEDLWLVTSDGCEPLHPLDPPYFQL